jgi:hypothetical protein
MTHETRQRPGDGLGDDLRERLVHLGRTATAGSTPWPGVDDAIRRRGRATTAATALLAIAVLLAATAVSWRAFGPPPAPAKRVGPSGVEFVWSQELPEKPWAAPAAPYRVAYADVRLRIPGGRELCHPGYRVDLRQPAVSKVSGELVMADVARFASCDPGVPWSPRLVLGLPSVAAAANTTPGECAADLREQTGSLSGGWFTTGAGFCAVTHPAAGEDPLLVRVLATRIEADGALELTATAWTGGPVETRAGPVVSPDAVPGAP